MKKIKHSDVLVNVTNRHLSKATGANLDSHVERAIAFLRNYPQLGGLDDEIIEQIEVLVASDVCLSPSYFFEKGMRLNKQIHIYLINQTDLGVTMLEALKGGGHLDFVDDKRDSESYLSEIFRIVAVFCMCTHGHDEFENYPLEAIHEIVDWFRTDNGARWREELWSSNEVGYQCLRAIILGIAELKGDPSLEAKAGQTRESYGAGPAWETLCRSEDPLDRDLTRRYADFEQLSLTKPRDSKQMVMDVAAWLKSQGEKGVLCDLLQFKNRPQSFPEFLIARLDRATTYVTAHVGRAKRFSNFVISQLEEEHPGVVFYSLVTQDEQDQVKNDVEDGPRKPNSTRSRPLPGKLHALAKEILDEGEAGWPGRSGYFRETVPRGKGQIKVYCPVVPTLLRTAMDLPLRMAQLRRLDSGEGDFERYDPNNDTWEDNKGHLAGYWSRLDGSSRGKTKTRGYAYRFDDTTPTLTGFFVNTNKTGNEYCVPWQHAETHKRLWELRNWQEKHNRMFEPIGPDQYLDKPEEYPIGTRARMPKIFPLARLRPKKKRNWLGRIPTSSEIDKAWQMLMAEVERRWNLNNPQNTITIVSRQKTTGQPQGSIYNLHGMRVRGLTDLRRGGMPLDLLSKFVAGHASLMMTLYYLEFEPAEIHQSLEKAVVERKAAEINEFIRDFKTMSIEEARRRSVSVDPNAIEEAVASPSKVEFCNVDIGFCPWNGTRCDDGGSKIMSRARSSGSPDKYGPVPGGKRNCVMCRHFVSGPPWAPQLELFGSKLCAKRQMFARLERLINEDVELLHKQEAAGEIETSYLQAAIAAKEVDVVQFKDEQEELENAIFNVEVLLTACVEILENRQGDGKSLDLIGNDRRSAVEYVQVPEFVRATMLTAASRVYPVLGDERIEAMRNARLDQIMHNAGEVPLGLRVELTERQRQKSMDMMAQLLLHRLKPQDVQSLADGDLRLQDFRIADDVKKIISLAVSDPVLIESRFSEPSVRTLALEEYK